MQSPTVSKNPPEAHSKESFQMSLRAPNDDEVLYP
jgi:hypothetical protein